MSKTTLMITALFVLALVGAYSVYKPFLLSISVAFLLTLATFNLTKYVTKYTNSARVSAVVTTLLMSLLLFAPIVYLATTGVEYLSQIDSAGIRETVDRFRNVVKDIDFLHKLSDQYLNEQKITEYIKGSAHFITTASSVGFGFVKNMLFVVVFYFFINYYGNRFFDTLLGILPISSQKGERMMQDVSATMEVVFYSIIVTAIFEGFLFGVMMSAFGFNGLLWGVIYGFASLIPVVGGIMVWGPVALYAWTKIDAQTALIIAVYSVVVISVVADTFIKPYIIKLIKEEFLKSTLQINSLIIFFSILAGMSTYGFWGMILGPAITSFVIAITKVYLEYQEE